MGLLFSVRSFHLCFFRVSARVRAHVYVRYSMCIGSLNQINTDGIFDKSPIITIAVVWLAAWLGACACAISPFLFMHSSINTHSINDEEREKNERSKLKLCVLCVL